MVISKYTSDRHREMIESKFKGKYEYIETETIENSNSNYHYYITAKCCYCGDLRRTTYSSFNKREMTCLCQDIEGMKKSAKKYAKILFTSLASEAHTYGLLIGEELYDYIKRCCKYDRPEMMQSSKYIDFVIEYVLKEYEDRGVKRCSCCTKWKLLSQMYDYDNRYCIVCNKHRQKEKREKRLKDRTYRRYR